MRVRWLSGYGAALVSAALVGLFTVLNKWLLVEEIPAVTLVSLKALLAGVVMGALALAFGQPLVVPLRVVPGIVASGAFWLGLSLAFFYMAMRHIGAGRTGLISSTSTFWGVIGALVLLRESLTSTVLAGGLLMVVGLLLFAWESTQQNRGASS